MQKLTQRNFTSGRNSSIELLKIFGIILVVISHVVQTLHEPNEYVLSKGYMFDISSSTTDIQRLILTVLRYSGAFGNTIFFICSAWFLLDSTKASKKKILQMLLDVWVISIIILIIVYIDRDGNIDNRMIFQQILPTTYENNWYITCYLLFYPLHPILNGVIKRMDQKSLLKTTVVLLFLYVGINFVIRERFQSTNIILWITLYFAIAYMKYYLFDISNNIKANIIIFAIGFCGNVGIVLFTNFIGLRFGVFTGQLLKWNLNCNPFLILMAVAILNIARNVHFKNKVINYVSGLSLLIYVIHENMLLRTYYRPMMWDYIYNRFGYEHILAWAFVLVVIVFGFGLIASIVYKNTLQRVIAVLCKHMYPILQKSYEKIEKKILKLH